MFERKLIPAFADTYITSNNHFDKLKLTRRRKLTLLILTIAGLQLLLRLGCLGEYGFHQDELLYLALSDHLAWGYREVPPFIALIGAFSKSIFGDSVAATRIIPSLCAAAVVIFTGLITLRLGGKFFAVTVACCAVAFSPAFLASGALFIPQVFDQLCWVVSAYLLILFIQDQNEHLLLYLGIICGIGMLVKYTFLFYIVGLLFGLLLQPTHYAIFKRKLFWGGVGVALLIFSPHLWWQYQNHFPAFHHYNELKETQLVYLSRGEFIIQQLVVNGTGLMIWLAGVALLFTAKYKDYRFLGIGFLVVMGAILLLNGKAYYAFGCFPPLFALGAISCERVFRKTGSAARALLIGFVTIPSLMLAIIVLPYLPIEKAAKVFEWTYTNLGIHYPLKWEDQKIHNMNQNYADMIGWDELAQKTSRLYQSLPSESKKHTVVLADKYGEAAAIDQYQKDWKLPPVISLCSSYALWAPQQLNAKNVIYISSNPPPSNVAAQKIDEITNPYARVVGMKIYLIKNVDSNTTEWYSRQWEAARIPKSRISSVGYD